METKTLVCAYDISLNSFKIEFDKENILEINIDKDVIFTDFVEKLSFKIAEKNKFELKCEESEDPKQKIVISALKEIVNSYNTILQEYVLSTTVDIL